MQNNTKRKPDRRVLEILREYKNIYTDIDDVYRANAYIRAIVAYTNGYDVTPGIAKKITMVARGEIPDDLLELRSSPEIKTLRILCSVLGVGVVTAREWYAHGIKSLRDLRAAVRGNVIKLNHMQEIGLKYHKQLNSRIPRADITSFVHGAKSTLSDYSIIPAGSYRRGANDSGDIDILIVSKQRPDVEVVLQLLTPHTIISTGPEKTSALYRINGMLRHVDLILMAEVSSAAALLYLTGSAEFNEWMRGVAKSQGKRLNQHGLYNNGRLISTNTERDIFAALGLSYVAPNKRI